MEVGWKEKHAESTQLRCLLSTFFSTDQIFKKSTENVRSKICEKPTKTLKSEASHPESGVMSKIWRNLDTIINISVQIWVMWKNTIVLSIVCVSLVKNGMLQNLTIRAEPKPLKRPWWWLNRSTWSFKIVTLWWLSRSSWNFKIVILVVAKSKAPETSRF